MHQSKIQAAKAALSYLKNTPIFGVGTGSTVNCFIDMLAPYVGDIEGCIASSQATAQRLKALGIPILDLNSTLPLPLYIDGADEVNAHRQLIKGGGGALTHEKIIATVAENFVCIVDASKVVKQLGCFPIAVEVLPMARSFVARELLKIGGDPEYRQGFISDNGNAILDVYHLDLSNPEAVEEAINQIPGVIENGLFIKRTANTVIVGESVNARIL